MVTGSTMGIGVEFAWQLAGTGHDLVLVSRDEARLEVVAQQIRHLHDVDIQTIAADLSDRSQLDQVARRLTDPVDPVSLLVNNPGAAIRGGFLATPVEDHERELDAVMRSVLVLCHAAASAMAHRRRGAIINVSSLAGYGVQGAASATKSWVTVFTEVLAVELEGTGVTATALLPGFVHGASGRAGAARGADGLPRITWQKSPFVVEQALRDAAKGKVLSIPAIKYTGSPGATPSLARRIARSVTSVRFRRAFVERRLTDARRRASKRRLQAPWQGDD